MKDVISVIVPVYNVAAYLPECLDSILSQDYDKLEVILIDDGSTDDSGTICDDYARRDSRIRVIHQKNGGAAAAKNAGLRAATGEYLSFADSDDFLEPGAYAYMLAVLKENDADIVRCAFQNRFRTRTEQWLAGEDLFPYTTLFRSERPFWYASPRTGPVGSCGTSCINGRFLTAFSLKRDTRSTTNISPIRAS